MLRWSLDDIQVLARPAWALPVGTWTTDIKTLAAGPDGGFYLCVVIPCSIGGSSQPQIVPARWVGNHVFQYAAANQCVSTWIGACSYDGRALAGLTPSSTVWIDGGMIPLAAYSGNPALAELIPGAIHMPGVVVFGTLDSEIVRWSPAGGLSVFAPPPGAKPMSSQLRGVSADGGRILGVAVEATSQRLRGFLWEALAGAAWLPHLPNGDWLVGQIMSGDGHTIIADAYRVRPSGPEVAGTYILRDGLPAAMVDDFLIAHGLNLRGFHVVSTLGLSHDGGAMCGHAISPCGEVQGWVAALGPVPICIADFNGSGVVSVQDLFDFLEGFFSQNPRADWNGSCDLTPQDLFDFLAAYFTGCP
jgi:hypothetical protein